MRAGGCPKSFLSACGSANTENLVETILLSDEQFDVIVDCPDARDAKGIDQ